MLKSHVVPASTLFWGFAALLTGLTLMHLWWNIHWVFDVLWTGFVTAAVVLLGSQPVSPPQPEQDTERLCEAAVMGWAQALKMGSPSAHDHSERTMRLCNWLGKELGLTEPEMKYLRWGALLHDIGKLGIPDHILSKPMHLSEEEYKVMQKHTEYGMTWMESLEFLGPAREVIYYHHERWDGQGYPLQLHTQEIPYLARIFSVVDVYDALTSDRCYRKALSHEEAMQIIQERAGTHFDPHIAGVFLTKMKQQVPV